MHMLRLQNLSNLYWVAFSLRRVNIWMCWDIGTGCQLDVRFHCLSANFLVKGTISDKQTWYEVEGPDRGITTVQTT